jgi:hypothetical protein
MKVEMSCYTADSNWDCPVQKCIYPEGLQTDLIYHNLAGLSGGYKKAPVDDLYQVFDLQKHLERV